MSPKNYKEIQNNPSIERTNILQKLANLTAKISLKYNIHHTEFYELFKRALVRQEKLSNKNLSIVQIACRTGIDRRYIKQYLSSDEFVLKPPKLKLILDEIKRICLSNRSKYIKKRGYFQSLESVCNQLASGSLTYMSIAKELLRKGHIIDKGNKFELVQWSYIPDKNDNEQQLRVLTTEMDRLTNTFIYNIDADKINDTQFQRNIFSTQILSSNFNEIKQQISNILNQTIDDVEQVILKYEEKVPTGTYPAFGASMFVFGCENSSEE